MYQIKKESYGPHLTFSGHIPKQEMEQWLSDSKEIIKTLPDEFVVFVDMRDMELLPPESRPIMVVGQEYYRVNGMQRSVVILKDKITKMQFKGIAKETGISEWERYIDANAEPNWEQVAMDWVLDCVDPDDKSKTDRVVCKETV
jgi:hypothetical protein